MVPFYVLISQPPPVDLFYYAMAPLKQDGAPPQENVAECVTIIRGRRDIRISWGGGGGDFDEF